MPFAERRSLSRPETGTPLFINREKEIGLYLLHYHRPPDDPQVRPIVAISAPGGLGKTRLLDELAGYDPSETIYSRLDGNAAISHDATVMLRRLVDGLHRAGTAVAVPRFDRLFEQRQRLLHQLLARVGDARQALYHFYRPVLLGLEMARPEMEPPSDQFAGLNWSRADLALAFGDPVGLLTGALVADLNQLAAARDANGASPARPAGKVVLIFDTYEQAYPVVNDWLLTYLLGRERAEINFDLRLVMAGREPPTGSDDRWQAWEELILSLSLEPFGPAEIADFVQKNTDMTDPLISRGLREEEQPSHPYSQMLKKLGKELPETAPRLVSPLWLTVWAVSGAVLLPQTLPTTSAEELLDGFSASRKTWLEKAAAAGTFDRERLAVLSGEDEGDEAFRWLVSQQALVRPGSTPGWFVLDRTVAETLLRQAAPVVPVLKQRLLDRLDRRLAELRQPGPASLPADYYDVLLERLEHSFWTEDMAPDAPAFLRAAFIEALDQYPPLMFDLLAVVDRSAPAGEQDRTAVAPLISLAEAWIAGHWTLMRPLLQDLSRDKFLPAAQKAQVYGWLGYTYSAAGDQNEAIELYSQGLDEAPDYWPLYLERGLAYFAGQNYDRAMADFNRAAGPGETAAAARQALLCRKRALAHMYRGEPDLAIADFSEALHIDPDHVPVLSERGRAYAHQGQFEGAIEDYDRALELSPLDPDLLYFKAEACVQMGQPAAAIDYLNQVLDRDPDYANAYYQRGRAYYQQNNFNQALQEFDQALKGQPDEDIRAQALYYRGLIFSRRGRYAQAVEDFDQAIALAPDQAMLLVERGRAYAGVGDHNRALDDLDRAIELAPQSMEAYINRGLVFSRLNDQASAVADYDQALALTSRENGERTPADLMRVLRYRGLALLRDGEYVQALEDFNQILRYQPQDTFTLNQRGLAYYKLGNYPLALSDFAEVLRLNPQHAEAVYNRGCVYLDEGSLDQAMADFNRAIQMEPKAEFFCGRGKVLALWGEYQAALENFTRALQLDSHQPECYYQRGLIYAYQNETELAIRDFKEAAALDLANADLYHNLGLTLANEGYYEQALENYNRALRLEPDNVDILHNRGLARAALRQYPEALDDFSRALELDPQNAATYNYRGSVYANDRDYRPAVNDFTLAIQLNPDEPTYYHNRGIVYMHQGLLDQAIEDFNQAARLNPDDPTLYNNRGNAYFRQGEYLRAVEDYNQALRLDPDNSTTLKNRGLAYRHLGNFQLAIQDYSRAVSLKPDDVSAYHHRGAAYEALGDFESAIGEYSQALAREPGHLSSLYNRAMVYYTLGQYERAMQDLNKVSQMVPDDPAAYYNRGRIHYQQGNYTAAMREFDRAIRIDPDHADAVYHKACVLALLEQHDAAITWLAQAIELNDDKRIEARNNSDFESLWYKPAFRKLFGYQ